jgi:hypothetical protein
VRPEAPKLWQNTRERYILFGESPVKEGTNLFGFTTPKKGGSKKIKKEKLAVVVVASNSFQKF